MDFFNRDFGSYENNEVMKCFMSTLGSFYKNNFLHYDPILTNFMIVPEKKPHEIIFLDFDSIIYNSWVSQGRTFIFISKLFYFFFAFLVNQNNEKECSRERILYYLEMFIKSYNPAIKTDDAYKYLIHGTIKLLKRKDKLSIKNKSLLSKIIESNAF